MDGAVRILLLAAMASLLLCANYWFISSIYRAFVPHQFAVEAVIGGLRGRPSWARNRADLAALAVGIGLDSALEMLPAGVERLAIVPDGILGVPPYDRPS